MHVTNGSMTLNISKGAFKQQFAPNGWTEVSAEELGEETVTVEKFDQESEELQEAEEEEVTEDEDEEEYEEVDVAELLEKPLSELDLEELQLVADYKGIDLGDSKSLKEIRKLIREAE